MILNSLFQDGMIFQANKPLRVFGTGEGHARVSLRGTAAEGDFTGGSWLLELPAQKYGGPYEMTIELNGETTVLRDVYAGDVYLLAGQSNLQFKLHESDVDPATYEGDSLLRLYSAERIEEGEPYTPEDGWLSCTKENAANWSCIGYLAGMFSRRERDRAVGMIVCYQGAADIQAFMAEELFAEPDFNIPWEERFDRDYPWNKGESILWHFMVEKLLPYSMAAVIWYQGESNWSAKESRVYGRMLRAMMADWRKKFLDGALKFIIVQIADNDGRQNEDWERIQQAQAEIGAEDENAVCVISRDVCESDKIHPIHKTVLSQRIAQEM